jgi:hypothetical protein
MRNAKNQHLMHKVQDFVKHYNLILYTHMECKSQTIYTHNTCMDPMLASSSIWSVKHEERFQVQTTWIQLNIFFVELTYELNHGTSLLIGSDPKSKP